MSGDKDAGVFIPADKFTAETLGARYLEDKTESITDGVKDKKEYSHHTKAEYVSALPTCLPSLPYTAFFSDAHAYRIVF